MGQLVNADPHGRIALQGYDPVSFHTAGTATKADPSISTEYRGYRYLFSSVANKAMFEEQPAKYLPAYGGYCAYGVANEVLAPVEIDTWEILDGCLVLQFSREVKQRFHDDSTGNIQRANDNWRRFRVGDRD